MPIRITFARLCLDTRIRLRLTQQQLADAVGVSHGYVAKIERGRANPSLELVERIARALDIELDFLLRIPAVIGGHRQRDLVHARCSGYVDRRLHGAGWLTAREVEIVHGRSHGWIDLLAFDPGTGTVLVIEVKTRLDDIGAIERQVGWYERSAFEVARGLGWRPRGVVGWLLVLASDEVEGVLRSNRDLMARAFPTRAKEMTRLLDAHDHDSGGRGVALIDPRSKRRNWLVPARIDGRRSAAPFTDYGDAAGRLGK
jgi:transcriptional regulator with XRE-family HTH domain